MIAFVASALSAFTSGEAMTLAAVTATLMALVITLAHEWRLPERLRFSRVPGQIGPSSQGTGKLQNV
jgi:hypothetical protein